MVTRPLRVHIGRLFGGFQVQHNAGKPLSQGIVDFLRQALPFL